jgi:hypothetical protein
MKDLGVYKTFTSLSYRCHFDAIDLTAFARGPLPLLTVAFQVSAKDENEARKGLSKEIGMGVFC